MENLVFGSAGTGKVAKKAYSAKVALRSTLLIKTAANDGFLFQGPGMCSTRGVLDPEESVLGQSSMYIHGMYRLRRST